VISFQLGSFLHKQLPWQVPVSEQSMVMNQCQWGRTMLTTYKRKGVHLNYSKQTVND